ncbi:MAG: AMP-binding protein, partial [Chloroflexota bacterium]|nr:AMP-binding protein [Chloroflexota bacterium]
MRTESAGRESGGASAPMWAAADAPVDLDAFVQRRLPVLPPGGEEHVVAMFRERSARFGPAPRWRARRDGVWRGMTWSENQALVNQLIAGLGALGAHAGTRVGILSETRWEWLAADWAILGLGAVTVPIYPSLTSSVVEFILNDANIEYLFVENAEQYEKLAQVAAPALKAIIALEPVEERVAPAQVSVMSFEELRGLSGASPEQAEALARDAAERIHATDIASVIYTSGTTGRPKGAIHTHASLMAQVRSTGAALTTFQPGMTHLLWLPLAHVLGREEHLLTVDRGGVTMVAGSIETLAQDIREARPNIIVGVPRIYEKAYAAIEARVKGAGGAQARIFAWAKAVGLAVVEARERGAAPSAWLRLRQSLADWLVFRKVREAFGGRVDFSITGGAPIASDLLRFFHAASILILEGWGLTETMGAVTVNRPENYRLGSV